MYLTQGLHRAIANQPRAIATVYRDRRRTFAEVGERVARFAGALQALGVNAGDRVGMLSLNSDRYIEYFMGVYWAGAAVNPVNIRWSPAEIAYSLDDCDTRVLLVDDQFVSKVPELRERSKALCTLIYTGEGDAPAGMLSYESLIEQTQPVDDAYRSGSDLAGVFYTGGTTGFPKGVMLTHASLAINALCLLAEDIIPRGLVGLHAAPMFHIADIACMNGMFERGATHVIVPSFSATAVLDAIETSEVAMLLLVPTMIQMLVDHATATGRDLSSIQRLLYGGSPISEAVVERTTQAMPNAQLYQVYGMTELSPAATVLLPAYHHAAGRTLGKVRSAGRAVLCAEVRIVGESGRELPRGEVGEVAVRSACVMLGYWNKPQETSAALRDGWMYTGDAGYMDEEGFVFIVDRLKDMIVTGGENVYSVEVENALQQHPAVASCAVIGVPDDQWGERVHAVVVLKPNHTVTTAALQLHCKTLIANYKCPREVELVSALPLSGAGKVLKASLRAPHWADRERRVG